MQKPNQRLQTSKEITEKEREGTSETVHAGIFGN
jgi:hypothetical protein